MFLPTVRSPVAAAYLNGPARPERLLKGEHEATAGATIAADGEFGVAVPLIVPAFVIAVPAVTLPVTRLRLFRVTAPCVERTSPLTFAPLSVIRPLLCTLAPLPWFDAPYGPTLESKLSTTAPVPPRAALASPTTPVAEDTVSVPSA